MHVGDRELTLHMQAETAKVEHTFGAMLHPTTSVTGQQALRQKQVAAGELLCLRDCGCSPVTPEADCSVIADTDQLLPFVSQASPSAVRRFCLLIQISYG
jgi:hypothetical protein